MTDASATAILGPQCPACGWRGGKHRPAAPGMGMEACPRSEPAEQAPSDFTP